MTYSMLSMNEAESFQEHHRVISGELQKTCMLFTFNAFYY